MEQIIYLGPEINIFLLIAEAVGLMGQQALLPIESTSLETELGLTSLFLLKSLSTVKQEEAVKEEIQEEFTVMQKVKVSLKKLAKPTSLKILITLAVQTFKNV